ncbi:MAG TPA: response regulator [Bacteroidia bacterium]|nr:response regulator [Bacteroidia bacterium]
MSTKYKKVFLVDDNPMDNMVNAQLISSVGFAVNPVVLNGGTDTLDMLKKAAPSELPELIFLDIRMPEMDGFQFLEEFEKLGEAITRHCKIILLSTSDTFKDLNRANKNKLVRRFLNKPLTSEMLAAINL